MWRRPFQGVRILSIARNYTRATKIEEARKELADISISPEQAGQYEAAVKIYNPAYSYEHPAFVAFPGNVTDVERCLQVASSRGVPVAIKSGGHCFAGYSSTDSRGFVISMKNLNQVRVDEEKCQVTVQSGACWGDVYSAVDGTAGCVVVGGCVPAVGVGGYILGGGYSLLSRNNGGLACDSAVSYTMVTADGSKTVTASRNENQDLFWALRGGGGGNFGVLVDVTLRLHPRPRQFKWSRLTYDSVESTRKGMEAVSKNLAAFPKELNLDMALHGFFGKKVLTLDAVYSSDHQQQVEGALSLLHPTSSTEPISYTSFLKFSTDYSRKHGFVHFEQEPMYAKGCMIHSIPTSLAKFFSEVVIPPECLIEFVHMGGDIQNLSSTDTAFPARSSQYSFYTYGRFGLNDLKHRQEVMQFATVTYEEVKRSGCSLGSYINYMDRFLDDWASEYYGVNYKRLCAIKEKWNPIGQGSLHFQQEIGSDWNPKSS